MWHCRRAQRKVGVQKKVGVRKKVGVQKNCGVRIQKVEKTRVHDRSPYFTTSTRGEELSHSLIDVIPVSEGEM